jgi:hypothetical protein
MTPCRAQGAQRDNDGCVGRQAYHQRIVCRLDGGLELRQRSYLPRYREHAGGVEEGQGGGGEAGAEPRREIWDREGDLVEEGEGCAGEVGCEDLVKRICQESPEYQRKRMKKSVRTPTPEMSGFVKLEIFPHNNALLVSDWLLIVSFRLKISHFRSAMETQK